MPRIETSVQTFIDPNCLQPTCEQYVPTQPTGCPPTKDLSWAFGDVTAGSTVSTTKSWPTDLANQISALGVVASALASSNVPSGLTFELLLTTRQGKLTGAVPKEGGKWTVVYNLLDRNKCIVARLTITINSPTTAVTCPASTALRWDFGEVATGTHLFTTASIPADILSRVKAAGITRVTQISSNLPSGTSLSLDLAQGLGVLSGNLPTAGASYTVVFGLFDGRGCEMFRLTVTLRAAAARVPELTVQIVKTAVEKVCEKDYSHAITVWWQASGGTAPVYVGPVFLIYPDGTTQAVVGTFPASGSIVLKANLSGGGTVTVRVQANDSAGRTKTAEAKVTLETCLQIGIIGPIVIRPTQYTLEVYARRSIAATPGYEELKVPVQVVGETATRTTPFNLTLNAGTQVTLKFPYRIAGGTYGRGLAYFDVWVGDATTPTRQNGTVDARREYVSITVTMSAKVKIVAWYTDIIG